MRIVNMGVIIKRKSYTVTIPTAISKDSKLLKACLKGLFDTDGCFTIKKGYYPVITFTTASFNLALQVTSELRKLGISCSSSYNQRRYDKRTHNLSIRNEVNINGFKNTKSFYTIIGSNNPKMIDRYQRTSRK